MECSAVKCESLKEREIYIVGNLWQDDLMIFYEIRFRTLIDYKDRDVVMRSMDCDA